MSSIEYPRPKLPVGQSYTDREEEVKQIFLILDRGKDL